MTIFTVVPESKIWICHDDVVEIGTNAGLKLFDTLTKAERKKVDEREYYETSIMPKQNNRPPMIVFKSMNQNYCVGYSPNQSEYTINLITLKPTKNSQNQTPIPIHIINRMKKRWAEMVSHRGTVLVHQDQNTK
jgi:hypothetical protein